MRQGCLSDRKVPTHDTVGWESNSSVRKSEAPHFTPDKRRSDRLSGLKARIFADFRQLGDAIISG